MPFQAYNVHWALYIFNWDAAETSYVRWFLIHYFGNVSNFSIYGGFKDFYILPRKPFVFGDMNHVYVLYIKASSLYDI